MVKINLFNFVKAMFSKEERSSFKYWFAHWCAFQMTALNLKCWKPRFLLHDIEKPWMKLWYRGDYKKVQVFHRNNNKHHIQYWLKTGKADWLAMVIDWECSRFTKESGQLNARDTLTMEVENLLKEKYITNFGSFENPATASSILSKNITKVLDKLGL